MVERRQLSLQRRRRAPWEDGEWKYTDYHKTAAGLPVVVRETTGGTISDYVYGTDLISTNSSGWSFYHADGLGSTRLLTNISGIVTDRYSYDAFGTKRNQTGLSAQPFSFTSEQVDSEAGMVFLRARYYDPNFGRFISADRFPNLASQSQSGNRYVYVQNNPITLVDPTGNAWYDFMDASKNGVNDFVYNNFIKSIPFIKDLGQASNGYHQYTNAVWGNDDMGGSLISGYMTQEDEDKFNQINDNAIPSLNSGNSAVTNIMQKTPGTSV